MIILCLRTDKPEAEIGVFDGDKKLAYISWSAHRQLAETIHQKLEELLNKSSISWKDIGGIVVYKGPGSFTGLRIGLSVANAVAYAQAVPVVARGGDEWFSQGAKDLVSGKNDIAAVPEYGGPAATTEPKK